VVFKMDNPIIELLHARRAGRSISREPLTEDIIVELIEAVRLTPSCNNNQPWRFLFLESGEALTKGQDALSRGNRAWAARAPLLIVGYSCRDDDCILSNDRAYHQFDLGMSAMNLMMAATYRGLTARPMAGFDPARIRQSFELDPDTQPLVMIAVGWPSDDESHLPDRYKGADKKPRQRKDASAIVRRL
jgi:nitroreductase